MEESYDRDVLVGVLGTEPIPKAALADENGLSREIAIFLLFISELNSGKIG